MPAFTAFVSKLDLYVIWDWIYWGVSSPTLIRREGERERGERKRAIIITVIRESITIRVLGISPQSQNLENRIRHFAQPPLRTFRQPHLSFD